MRSVFKTRHFSRWMRKTELSDRVLCVAVSEMEKGLIDADLGGSVIKKRVPLPGRGKSASTRILVATNKGDRWFFVFGFEKNERSNVTEAELESLREIAKQLLVRTSKELDEAVGDGSLQEICHDNEG